MANNYFVSYELMAPGRHYERVADAIEAAGDWAMVEPTLYYLKSSMDLAALTEHVWASMKTNDKLIVIDTTGNDFYAHNMDQPILEHIQARWNS